MPTAGAQGCPQSCVPAALGTECQFKDQLLLGSAGSGCLRAMAGEGWPKKGGPQQGQGLPACPGGALRLKTLGAPVHNLDIAGRHLTRAGLGQSRAADTCSFHSLCWQFSLVYLNGNGNKAVCVRKGMRLLIHHAEIYKELSKSLAQAPVCRHQQPLCSCLRVCVSSCLFLPTGTAPRQCPAFGKGL